jgi:hypothetical protein
VVVKRDITSHFLRGHYKYSLETIRLNRTEFSAVVTFGWQVVTTAEACPDVVLPGALGFGLVLPESPVTACV